MSPHTFHLWIEQLLIPVGWTGASLSIVAAVAADMAFGARHGEACGLCSFVWISGVAAALVPIAVDDWAPLTWSFGALGIMATTSVVARAAGSVLVRPRYRREAFEWKVVHPSTVKDVSTVGP